MLACLALLGCEAGRAPATSVDGSTTLPRLHATAQGLVDPAGRHVLLRGLNHIGLRSDRNRPSYRVDGAVTPDSQLFDLQDLEAADFDTIAGFGFNLIRLVVTWEFAQPDPPPAAFNEAYFQRIDDFIAKAAARDIYVMFDFGQFGWGRGAGGNAGAPDWTISAACAQLPGPTGGAPPQASVGVGCNYYNFWTNSETPGHAIQSEYFALWRHVARRYGDNPAVPIFDLHNEPFGGPIPPGVFEPAYLYPYYRELAADVRAIAADVIIGFQPEIFHSIGVPTPFALPIGIDNAMYLPHEYTLAYLGQRLDPAYPPGQDLVNRAYLAAAASEAQIFGTSYLIGETGWTRSTSADGVEGPIAATDPTAPPAFARDFTALADEALFGWAWFAWSSIDPAYGVNVGDEIDQPLMQALARPFAQAVDGQIDQMHFDPDSRIFRLALETPGAAATDIALPWQWQYPQGICVEIDGERRGMDADQAIAIGAFQAISRRLPARLRIIPSPAQLQISPRVGDCI